MRKSVFSCLGLIMVFGIVLSSCDRSRDYSLQNTYSDGNGLEFMLNDSVMRGCTANLYTDGTGYAAIEVDGAKVDLSVLLSELIGKISIPGLKAAPKTSVVSNCVLPGSSHIRIDDVLLKSSGDSQTFSGTGESEYCTFAYNGAVGKNSLNLKFSDVRMKNELPLPVDKVKLLPVPGNFIGVDWQYREGEKVEFPIADILSEDGLILPILGQLLTQKVQAMSVYKSGDVTLTLADHESGKGAAQYVVLNESDMRVFLNIPVIAASALSKAGAEGGNIEEIIKSIVPILGQYLAKMINEGIIIHYSLSATGMSVTLDSATVIKIMNLLSLALSSEELLGMLQSLLETKLPAEYQSMLPMILNVIKALPENISATSKLDISFNFSMGAAPVPDPTKQKTFRDGEGLTFMLNDSVMHGCTVDLYKGDQKNMSIEVRGASVDLGTLLPMLAEKIPMPGVRAGANTSIVSTCVLPGSPLIRIDNIALGESGGLQTFSGNGSSDYCTFSYSGSLKGDALDLKFFDVKMNRGLPLPADKVRLYPAYGNFIVVDWQYKEGQEPEMNLGEFLGKEGFVMPLLNQLLMQKLRAMTVYKSGDLTLSLADSETRRGTAQYVICNETDMRAYINVPEIVTYRSMTKAGVSGGGIIESLIPILAQYIANQINSGFLAHYSVSATGMSVTLDSDAVLEVLNLAGMALASDDVMAMLQGLIESKLPEDIKMLSPVIMEAIRVLPENLAVTEKLDISFNFSFVPADM